MTIFAATDFTISIAGVDLTSFCNSATVNFDAAELPTTAFGQDWTSVIGGLKSGSVSFDLNQNFASGSVDATLFAALGTVVAVVVKPTSGSISATNPSYSFSCLASSYSPISAGVGDLATTSISWNITGAATRNVS
jgi:hypothetical protein